jgi:hypothetical protein
MRSREGAHVPDGYSSVMEVRMTVNIENIDKIIEWIKADQAKHFKMRGWQNNLAHPGRGVEHFEYCNTAFCIAGWIDQHLQREDGATDETLKFGNNFYGYRDKGADFLGLDPYTAGELFLMNSEEQRMKFDKLPNEERADIAVKVLENLKETGRVTWDDFVDDPTGNDYADDDND